MPLRLSVNPHSGIPIYLQIAGQVQRAIAAGVLVCGEALPSVKTISTELLVNPATVSRALRELEHSGVIVSRVGRGSFVSDRGGPIVARRAAGETIARGLDALLRDARAFGLDGAAMTQIFQRHFKQWYPLEEEREAHDRETGNRASRKELRSGSRRT